MTVILESFGKDNAPSWRFEGVVEEITARLPQEVVPALIRIEKAAEAGFHAAGFVSYEAASGLSPELTTHPVGPLPLLWFGVFRERIPVRPGEITPTEAAYETCDWRPSLSPDAYAEGMGRIRDYIAAGDAYQVNFTMKERFRFRGDPFAYYRALCRAQSADYCAYLDTGGFKVLSASPELFFQLKEGALTVRPMKGTAGRGRWYEEDEEAKERLRESPKERAENLMIVDLLRNDLGMVSETGSVEVASLFRVETLETVHQMTSTVTSRLKEKVGLVELFRALFPCGSITGAPKKRAMEIIAELENSPRGVYTGCIGHISPGPEMVFSVAIRTAVIDSADDSGEMGVGSGVTWDSKAGSEYDECLAKAVFAQTERTEFRLIETLLFEEGSGYFLLERHLARLGRSAEYFGFAMDLESMRMGLAELAGTLSGRNKVRLLLSRTGAFSHESAPIENAETEEPLIAFAGTRVNSADPFLYHKTTNRPLYTSEPALHPGCVDVIFLNERGEATEGANNNLAARINGRMLTPPLSCGLLPGVFREELLARGEIVEEVIPRAALERAEEIYLINSVRKWRRVRLERTREGEPWESADL